MKKKLTIRAMQVIGAIYFREYCRVKKISDPSIDKFIEHNISIATAQSLPDWEQEGTTLELTGRGDPLPVTLEAKMDEAIVPLFQKISSYVCEIGLAQMYGATDMKMAQKFLKDVEKIARRAGVKKIYYKLFETGEDDWGKPITQETLEQWLTSA